MNRAEAKHECERLAAEHVDRADSRWVPQEMPDGNWRAVKVGIAPPDALRQAELLAEEKPPTPDDPRSSIARDIPGYQ
jgi:hypothetical protein